MNSTIGNQIKSRIDMFDVANRYDFDIKRGGFISCPLHAEKTPSLKLYKGDRGYYCFGCNKGGDVIAFVMSAFGISYQSAIIKINEDFMLGLPIGRQLTHREKIKFQKETEARITRKKHTKIIKRMLRRTYYKWLELWADCDYAIYKYAPKGDEVDISEFDERYVNALHKIEFLRYKMYEALDNWRKFDDEQ